MEVLILFKFASLDTDIMSVAKVEKKFTVWCAEREKTHLKYTVWCAEREKTHLKYTVWCAEREKTLKIYSVVCRARKDTIKIYSVVCRARKDTFKIYSVVCRARKDTIKIYTNSVFLERFHGFNNKTNMREIIRCVDISYLVVICPPVRPPQHPFTSLPIPNSPTMLTVTLYCTDEAALASSRDSCSTAHSCAVRHKTPHASYWRPARH